MAGRVNLNSTPNIIAIGGGWYRNRCRGKRTIYANATTHETREHWPIDVERPNGKEWESSGEENSEDEEGIGEEHIELEISKSDEDLSAPVTQWEEHNDIATGMTYYVNRDTGESSWSKSISNVEIEWAKEKYLEATTRFTHGNDTLHGRAGLKRTLDRNGFKSLCRELFGEKSVPSESDLNLAFMGADTDNSGDIDEYEFFELYTLVKEGKVHGLSKSHFEHNNFDGGAGHMSRSLLSFKRRKKARHRLNKPEVVNYKGLTFKPLSNFSHDLAAPLQQGRKLPQYELNEDSLLSFLFNTFRCFGTVFENLCGQLILAFLMLAATHFIEADEPSKFKLPDCVVLSYKLFGRMLAFFLVFRLQEAIGAFTDGRRNLDRISGNLRDMIGHVYCSFINDDAPREDVEHARREIVRLANLLFALMRQALRESNDGFTPGSSLYGKSFSNNWQVDPVEPRLVNLMTKEEYEELKVIPCATRPTWVQSKMYLLANNLSGFQEVPGRFVEDFVRKHMEAMDAYKSCIRIMETPVPMPYRHLILLLTCLFVYIYPWIVVHENREAKNYTTRWIEVFFVRNEIYCIVSMNSHHYYFNDFYLSQIDNCRIHGTNHSRCAITKSIRI